MKLQILLSLLTESFLIMHSPDHRERKYQILMHILLASAWIHMDAKTRISCLFYSNWLKTSARLAEGVRFKTYEGPSFFRSVTYDPWQCLSSRCIHLRANILRVIEHLFQQSLRLVTILTYAPSICFKRSVESFIRIIIG